MYIYFGGFVIDDFGKGVGAEIVNDSWVDAKIGSIRIQWPDENDRLLEIHLDPPNILWDDGDDEPPTWATGLRGDTKIPSGWRRWLVAMFENVVFDFYEIKVIFEQPSGCTIYGYPN